MLRRRWLPVRQQVLGRWWVVALRARQHRGIEQHRGSTDGIGREQRGRAAAPGLHSFRHPVVLAVAAAVGFTASWLLALRRPLPGGELRITSWLNGAPGAVAVALYPVMQLGTFAGVIVAAAVVWMVRRDRFLVLALVVTTILSWLLAKLVKQVVDRGRPAAYLPDIVVRDEHTTALGYVSSHSAVAATVAVFVVVAVPGRWRPLVVLLAVVVGVARVVYGVHFPADVVGGWSLGLLVGVAGLAVLDRFRPAAARGSAGAAPGEEGNMGRRSGEEHV